MARRSCGVIALVILALLVGIVVGAWWVGGRDLFSRVVPGLAGPPSHPHPETKPGPLRAHFTEAELTEQLHQSLKGKDTQNIALRLEPDLLVVTGELKRGFLSSPFRVELTPFVEGGQVKVKIKRAALGNIPVPSDMSLFLANQAARALSRQQEKVPGLVIDTVDVKQGVMDITGHIDSSRIHAAPQSTPK